MSLALTHDPGAHASLCREFRFEIEWTPQKRYYPGTLVELRVQHLRCLTQWKWKRLECDTLDVTYRYPEHPTMHQMWQNRTHTLLRGRLPYAGYAGEAGHFRVGAVPGIYAEIGAHISLWTQDTSRHADDEFPWVEEEGSRLVLPSGAGPVEFLALTSRPAPEADGKVRTAIVPEDRFGNAASFAQPVELELRWCDQVIPLALQGPTVTELPAVPPEVEVARCEARLPVSALALGENVRNARLDDDALVIAGSPVWPQPINGMIPGFGEIHWHTKFSGDGQRPIAAALLAGRDLKNMDFIAPGDHTPRGERWKETVEPVEAAHEPGKFATFFGYEQSSDRGHVNLYFTDPDHRCGPDGGLVGQRPETYLDSLTGDDFLAIPHHTNAVAESKTDEGVPYWHPFAWGKPRPFLRLVEIMQVRGNQETDEGSDIWRRWHQGNQASYQDALRGGHRVGFTGGTDNHCGWPGRAYSPHEGAATHAPRSNILTGVWTEKRDRQEVFDALCRRATWATWDTRAIIDFRVNGAPAGSEIAVAAGAKLTVQLRLSAEDALWLMEIISEGRTVWQGRSTELDVRQEIDLGVADRETHFYFRALQRDGAIIYASPVFIDLTA